MLHLTSVAALLPCLFIESALASPRPPPVLQSKASTNRNDHYYQKQGRIVGGTIPEPHSIPYIIFILVIRQQGNSQCGGALIKPDFVLTAAHCLRYPGTLEFQISAGAHYIVDYEPDRQTRTVPFRNSQIFQPFNNYTLENDIGYLQLTEPFNLVPGIVETIRLPRLSQKDDQLIGFRATISGWGYWGADPELFPNSDFLQVLEPQYIISNYKCDVDTGETLITDTMLCIEGVFLMSPCMGDSGGPLTIVEPADKIRTLVGINSKTVGLGCMAGYPPIFTRVTKFLDWISANAGINLRP